MEWGKDDRLEGVVVRRIWMCSNLNREKLRAIWYDLVSILPFHIFSLSLPWVLMPFFVVYRNDCEGSDSGSLDVDAFAKAMWRIDEELRKARLNPPPHSGYGSLSSRRIGSILR